MNAPEPRNPLYLPMLAVCVLFVMTALAVAVVPTLQDMVPDTGPSPIRDALNTDGWKWLLYELAVLIVLALACMGLDRWRSRK